MKDYIATGWLPEQTSSGNRIEFVDDHDSCITEWTSATRPNGSRVCVALNRICGAYHVTVDHFDGSTWRTGAPEIFDTCIEGLHVASARIDDWRVA